MVSRQFIIVLCGLLSACANLSPQLAKESEIVFRQQNEIASELLLRLDELPESSPLYQQLLDAESAMLEACKPLNDVAIGYRNQKRIGLLKKLKVPNSIDRCREETNEAAKLLDG